MGPATLLGRAEPASYGLDAQRRPARWGRQPRTRALVVAGTAMIAQRRPARWGRQPRHRTDDGRHIVGSLNEGRPGGAGNPCPRGDTSRSTTTALNEGRPGGAGNPRDRGRTRRLHTTDRSTKAGPVGPATLEGWSWQAARLRRSTKAGPVGPATLREALGRHLQRLPRSTKAGPVGPATLLPTGCTPAQRAGTRSTKAGPVGPATPVRLRACRSVDRCAALNEGRPGGAGNPGCGRSRARYRPRCHRSTKAGPVGPATPRCIRSASPKLPAQCAQRRPARWGRQPSVRGGAVGERDDRSTKAGPVGPATPGALRVGGAGGSDAQRRPARWGRQPAGPRTP